MKKRRTLATIALLCVSTAMGAVAADVVKKITAELRPDFTILIDGEERVFKNAQGEVVYPVLYEGTTYLPLRAIGELMNKTVYWYESDKRIELKDEKTTVTDADVIITDNTYKPNETDKPTDKKPENKVDESKFIGENKAKEAALLKAGLSANDVTFIKVKLDRDNGVWQYEVEFRQGVTEYEVDVNAESGTIISFEKDID